MITSDVVVIGSELEALVAALRLLENGASVRLLASGAGSLAYSPGGIALLGYKSADKSCPIVDPWRAIDELTPAHPLRLVGSDTIRNGLTWFDSLLTRMDADWVFGKLNHPIVAISGALRPVLGRPRNQAALLDMAGRRIGLVDFQGFQDFPAHLLVAGLRRYNIEATAIPVALPPAAIDSARLGQLFDRPEFAVSLLNTVRDALRTDIDIVVFPAVLGLAQHRRVVDQAAAILDRPVFEAATMPPSLLGIRLYRALTDEIERLGGLLHLGIRSLRAQIKHGQCDRLRDGEGHEYTASQYIVGTGGILMAGLNLSSDGVVSEPVFDLTVHQTTPLSKPSPAETIEALHQTGIETDPELRPIMRGGQCLRNLRVVGTTLAHWNPFREESLEGVGIATGWAAANGAARMGRA